MNDEKPKRLSIAEKRAMTGRFTLGQQYSAAETAPEPDRKADRPSTAAPDPSHKKPISLRLDPDVLAFFRSEGPGYQTRMNAILRRYVEARNRLKPG